MLRAIAREPGWQLVAGGLLLAWLFPSRLSGSIGLAIVCGGLGVAVAKLWPRLPEWLRTPDKQLAHALVIAIVAAAGLTTYWTALTVSPDWQAGDWGPQRAVLAGVIDSLPGLDTPAWNHAVGTGDAPLELYPKLTYLLTGHIAILIGLDDDLPHAMMIVAVLVHVGTAVTTALIAARIAPKPIAIAVGLLAVVDSGAVAHGGSVGLFRWGLLHSALALLFATIAALGVIGALQRPRLRSSIAIWIGTALACATHPAGLIAAAATIVGLSAVALLATDIPARRSLVAIGHVALGVALGAIVWMPLAERILAYGQHFPNQVDTASKRFEQLLATPSPTTAFAFLAYAGYFGILAGLWSRRATVVFIAAVALVLLVGLVDAPYLALDLVPGQGVARLGTERLAALARPFLAAAGAYAIALLAAQVIASWRDASQRRRTIAAAVIGVLACALLRELPAVWRSASNNAAGETRVLAADSLGRNQLVAWAHREVAAIKPGTYARALFDVERTDPEAHTHFHLTAETGLPTLHNSWQPDLLLRERIEDNTPESLRRFNIKWVIGVGRSPTFGDAASEVQLGSFRIRTLPEWDGKFARVERGAGEVTVTRFDNEAVEVDVRASAPVLVALGTGFYPRWRATHASGAELAVYAMRSTDKAKLSVVSAWVPPGKTTFTVDGALPSDGDGRVLAILALLLAIAGAVTWSVKRWRVRALRRIATARAATSPRLKRALPYVAPAVIGILFIRGCIDRAGSVRALELGTGVRRNAVVQARIGGDEWQTCSYQRIEGTHVCSGMLVAYDGITSLLNDAQPSWAFNTAGFHATAEAVGVEMRVVFREHLAGTYWIAATGDNTVLEVSEEQTRILERAIVTYGDRGTRTIELRTHLPPTPWSFTFVREDTIMPSREFLESPPIEAPESIMRIR